MAKRANTPKAIMRVINGNLKLEQDAITRIFLKQMDNIYGVKKHLLVILPQLSAKASFADLKKAIVANIDVIKVQVLRMDVIYKVFKVKYNPDNCTGIKNFALDACEAILLDGQDPLENDLALLTHLQIIESLEAAYFNVLKNLAAGLGNGEVETMLKQNFDTAISSKRLYELITNEYLN